MAGDLGLPKAGRNRVQTSRRITVRVSASGPLTRPSELTFTLSRAVQGTARARPKVRKPLIR
jgi:hypothetical protein